MEKSQGTNEGSFMSSEYIENPENRERIKCEFQRAIEATLAEFSDKTGDSEFTFEKIAVPYQSNPPVVLAMATISSKKLQYFCISWLPAKKNLARTMIMVRHKYRRQGVASTMNLITEAIARKLGCTSVTVQAIVETSMDYWRKKPDFKLDETSRSATKYFEAS
jgi:hypothetical protein